MRWPTDSYGVHERIRIEEGIVWTAKAVTYLCVCQGDRASGGEEAETDLLLHNTARRCAPEPSAEPPPDGKKSHSSGQPIGPAHPLGGQYPTLASTIASPAYTF